MSFSQNFKKKIQSDRTRTDLLLDLEKEVEDLQVEEGIKEDILAKISLQIYNSRTNEEDYLQGIISREEYILNRNKCTYYLLKMNHRLDKLKNSQSNTPNESNSLSKKSTPTPKESHKSSKKLSSPSKKSNNLPKNTIFSQYTINWEETILWFQHNRETLAEELTNAFGYLNEDRKSKFKTEILLIVNWINHYWVKKVIDVDFNEWINNKLAESKFESINPELLAHGINNLLELNTDKDLSNFIRDHINEHLEVCANLILNYFDAE